MTLRARLALLTAAILALSVAALAAIGFLLLRNELNRGLDQSLLRSMAQIQREQQHDGTKVGQLIAPSEELHQQLGATPYFTQLVTTSGRVIAPAGASMSLPATAEVRRIAATGTGSLFYSTEANGQHLRVLAQPYLPGAAVMMVAPTQELDRTVLSAGLAALAVAVAGAALGGLAGHLVAQAAVGPLRRLTLAAERITRTRDLSTRLPASGRDEISRLAMTFNHMLAALDDAVSAQRRLVADASHELRTPLTSLRTNIELLASHDEQLPAAERQAILHDAVGQARDLGHLMTAILDLARDQEPAEAHVPVAVDEVVRRALVSARRDWPDARFEATLSPFDVLADASRLERAVVNLLGNAAKYGAGAPIQVVLAGGVLTVSDGGPGIPEEERELVFERFHRSRSMRDRPGSGLGLAIVRQAVQEVGGTVTAGQAPGGGARLTVDLRQAPRPHPESVSG